MFKSMRIMVNKYDNHNIHSPLGNRDRDDLADDQEKCDQKHEKRAKFKIFPPSNSIVIHPLYQKPLIGISTILIVIFFCLTIPVESLPNKRNQFRISRRSPITSTRETIKDIEKIFTDEELLSSQVVTLLEDGYHNDTESLSAAINRLVQNHPKQASSLILGRSIGKNPILGLKIATNANLDPDSLESKPGVVFLGGIHGDHALGHELTLFMGAFLLDMYDKDIKVKKLVDSMDIFLIPTLNPDGFQRAHEGDCFSSKLQSGRNNLANVDLDTDFKFHNYADISAILANNNLQPETKALVEWLVMGGKGIQLFATLRTGLTGFTYPFDETPNQITEHTYINSGHTTDSNAAPDATLFEFLGNQVYYRYQKNPTDSECNPIANNITVLDGARIGSTYGTLNDFLYRYTNAFPINIYLDCCKYPHRQDLQSKWLQHANSLFALIASNNLGLRGKVTDGETNKPILRARVMVSEFGKNVTSLVEGEFWRILPPGTEYELQVEADGYLGTDKRKVTGLDLELAIQSASPIKLDFVLNPIISHPSSTARYEEKNDKLIDKKENPVIEEALDSLPSTYVLKPKALFEDVDLQIQNIDFKTPTELQKHHKYKDMVKILKTLNGRYPKLTRLYDIGTSVQGKKLWVLEISDKPGVHQTLKPEFRYVANMHGNEVVGRELVLNLAKLLLENYGSNSLVTAIVNSTRIHLLPSMNPDGYEKSTEGDCEGDLGRVNANNYDLNRNFPDRFKSNTDNIVTQPEVDAIMSWSKQYPFVLGANLHGGSLVANYPYDGNKQEKNGRYEASPDDKLFVHLAKTYSSNHPTMSKGDHCYDICGDDRESLLNERFPDGITNGAHWYVLYGGIQDWVYLNTNCLSITVELGCKKFPLAKDMPRYWADNKKPLVKYMLEAHRGIYGVVTDQNGRPLMNATIHVKGLDHDIHSANTGDYWRLLLPGEFFVSVTKEGFRTAHRTVTVGKYGSPAQRVDFSLSSGPKDLSSNPEENTLFLNTDSSNLSDLKASVKENSHESIKGQVVDGSDHNRVANNSLLIMNGSRLGPVFEDGKYMLALCFIIVLPSIILLVYMFGLTDSKRYPYRFGFSRLATSVGDDLDGDDDDEGTRFVKRTSKGARFTSLAQGQGSDSEDELYSVDDWKK